MTSRRHLEELTVRELRGLAREAGLSGYSRKTKGELVDALLASGRKRSGKAARPSEEPAPPRRRSPRVPTRKAEEAIADRAARSRKDRRVETGQPPPSERSGDSNLESAPSAVREEAGNEPREGGTLHLLPIDPWWAHVSWDLDRATLSDARRRLGGLELPIVLRFLSGSTLTWDDQGSRFFEITVGSPRGEYYLNVWKAGMALRAEAGVRSEAGVFEPLLRSRWIELPAEGESTIFEDRRQSVRETTSPLWRPRRGVVEEPVMELVGARAAGAAGEGPGSGDDVPLRDRGMSDERDASESVSPESASPEPALPEPAGPRGSPEAPSRPPAPLPLEASPVVSSGDLGAREPAPEPPREVVAPDALPPHFLHLAPPPASETAESWEGLFDPTEAASAEPGEGEVRESRTAPAPGDEPARVVIVSGMEALSSWDLALRSLGQGPVAALEGGPSSWSLPAAAARAEGAPGTTPGGEVFAEVVLRGSGSPGSRVTVGGRATVVGEDGVFELRVSAPLHVLGPVASGRQSGSQGT